MTIRVTTTDGRNFDFPADMTLSVMVSHLQRTGAIKGNSMSLSINIESEAERHDNTADAANDTADAANNTADATNSADTPRPPYVEDRRWGAPWPGANFTGTVLL